ncbi:MAG: hypothetical protein RSA50_08970, partial [Mucinivorans sp.]
DKMKYMLLKDNIVQGFYSSDINFNISNEAIEITEELYKELINLGQARLKNNKTNNFNIADFESYTKPLTVSEINEQKIREAQNYLNNTDYIITKLAEYQITGEISDKDYTEVLAKREKSREIIRSKGE